jgi:DNA-binding IclR family transcriptional regulator
MAVKKRSATKRARVERVSAPAASSSHERRRRRRAGGPVAGEPPDVAPGEPARSEKYFTRAVGKALEIVRLLGRSPAPLPLNEIAREVDLTKSSVFRLMHTLEVEGFVARDGLGFYQLVAELRPLLFAQVHGPLKRLAAPILKWLGDETEETVGLGLLCEKHIEVIAVVESPQTIRMGNVLGRILPPHSSSMGKAILGFLPEEARETLIASYGLYRYTPNTIIDRGRLREELDRIKQRGHSMDMEENTIGGICVGAPIFDSHGRPCAALSISMPSARWHEGDRGALVRAVRDAASRISDGLRQAAARLVA